MTAAPTAAAQPQVLAGIRVLDFTERIQGPWATQTLGDLGAEIIKVERVRSLTPDGRPDERYPMPPAGLPAMDPDDPGHPSLYSATFLAANRNKKSVTVDLKSPDGKEVVRRLVGVCDVVYENFRPGVMARLGFGYEDCAAINPSIVYASASGYGPDGPYAAKPGQDVLAQAVGGFGAINVSGAGRPTPVGMSITDVLGGMNGAFAVLAALFHRERTGQGQRVEVCLLDSAIAAQSEQAVHFLNTGVGEPVRGTVMHAHPYIPPPYGFYATKDGYLALSSGRQIPQLAQILGAPELLEERFSGYWGRQRHRVEMEEILEARLRTRTSAEWLEVMEAEDLFVAPVKSFAETFSDPQVVHNQMVVTVDSPIGALRLIGPAFRLSATPPRVRSAPPTHGQHTDEVLALIGYTPEQITTLHTQGAV
jgi:crotonobetainyl-CoA:carnitine CoA-transferase CaiB-like acyl-CoA transferase